MGAVVLSRKIDMLGKSKNAQGLASWQGGEGSTEPGSEDRVPGHLGRRGG